MVQGRWTDGKRRVAARGWEVGRTRAILRGGSIDRGEERMPAGGSRAVAFPEEGRGWGRRFWGKGDGCGRSHAGRPDSGCLGQGLAGLLGRVDSIWTRGDEGATRIPDYSVNSRTLPPRPQCSLSRQRCSLNLKKKKPLVSIYTVSRQDAMYVVSALHPQEPVNPRDVPSSASVRKVRQYEPGHQAHCCSAEFSLAWKLMVFPKTAGQGMPDCACGRKELWPALILIGSAKQ